MTRLLLLYACRKFEQDTSGLECVQRAEHFMRNVFDMMMRRRRMRMIRWKSFLFIITLHSMSTICCFIRCVRVWEYELTRLPQSVSAGFGLYVFATGELLS